MINTNMSFICVISEAICCVNFNFLSLHILVSDFSIFISVLPYNKLWGIVFMVRIVVIGHKVSYLKKMMWKISMLIMSETNFFQIWIIYYHKHKTK